MRLPFRMIAAGVLWTAAVAAAAAPQADNTLAVEEQAANRAMAEKLAQMAQQTLLNRGIVPATVTQTIALLEAAERLNPAEPRFSRLLAVAYQQQGGEAGRQGEIDALSRYLKLEPADLVAQMRVIDLHFSQIDAADQRGNYIDQLFKTPQLAAEVRAHVATLGARLAFDRAEDKRGNEYIEEALKLFPLSPEALVLKYQYMAADMSPDQRVALQLQLLRCNPVRPGLMADLAEELAAVGLIDPSLYWYATGFGVAQRAGSAPDPTDTTNFGAEMVIADQLSTAQQMIKSIMNEDAANSDAAFLNLLIEKRNKDEDKIRTASESVRSAVLTRLSRLSDQLHEKETATTQASTDVDMAADVKLLGESGNADMTAAYASGLSELCWLSIYFNAKPAEAESYMAALRQLLAPDSATLARLDGWSYLVGGKKDEARVKLSAVAASDALSELGMIKLEQDSLSAAELRSRIISLLNKNASGLTGALLIEAFRDKMALMPRTPASEAVQVELDKFPKDWIQLTDFSKTQFFYSVKGEPLKVAHAYGEPMLARITITNTSTYDLTIGPDAAIHPDIWIDARVTGMSAQNLSGVTFDRIGQKVLLHPKESASQVMRVDQGAMTSALQADPRLGMTINFSVVTNPIQQELGVAPGPGGYRAMFTHTVQRTPAPFTPDALQKQFSLIQDGHGDVRIRSLELMGAFVNWLKAQNDPATKDPSIQIADFIRKSTGDRLTAVRAQSMFISASLAESPARDSMVKQMLSDPSPATRVIGLMALEQLEPAVQKELAKELADSDSDPTVRKLAGAVIEIADLPPPSTQPATEPATTQPAADFRP
ncbi:MAG TPA: hypothetical protein VHD56_08460 [Tepidisphaeraceae bacterium]|nr:hypothetical protein [Tepidisphaeraceae bacterium]